MQNDTWPYKGSGDSIWSPLQKVIPIPCTPHVGNLMLRIGDGWEEVKKRIKRPRNGYTKGIDGAS